MGAQESNHNQVVDEMISIVTMHNNELPLCVSEYFLYLYHRYILTNIKLDFRLIKKIIKYHKDIFLIFDIKNKNTVEFSGFNLYLKDINEIDVLAEDNAIYDFMFQSTRFEYNYIDSGFDDSFTITNPLLLKRNYAAVLIVRF